MHKIELFFSKFEICIRFICFSNYMNAKVFVEKILKVGKLILDYVDCRIA